MNSLLLKKVLFKLTGVVNLKTRAKIRGRALISYITSPFLQATISNRHTNSWECREIASILLEMGYDVDIINWDNQTFIPRKNYAVYLDIYSNLERLAPYLTGAKKIFHITGAHWKFMNQAEQTRLLDLERRRGVTLKPNRSVKPGLNIEYADYCASLGNDFTSSTYAFANKPIVRIPISTTHTYTSPENKDFDRIRKNYIWLGGSGMIHKGLDLVLETFTALPDYHLTIIGPVEKESDFVEAYRKELYETSNIKLAGWLDLGSEEFDKIRNESLGIIYPSCSEGGGGSVITAMHAGLIPIVSRESSVDTHDFGITLPDSSIESIKKNIENMSSLPVSILQEKALQTWKHARSTHTREEFSKAYRVFLKNILDTTSIPIL
ncbi:MAG: glycosyltransferase [Candidatus Pacebacteria bacterium]|nr:glycosyltransferase [Candidatus Paceibacterota bacterium]